MLSQELLPPGAFLESNGSVVLEAENATDILPGSGVAATHTWTTNNTFAGFTGTGAMRALPADGTNTGTPDAVGPRLRYAITFQTPGDYYVYVRGFAPQADQDSVHVGLDGTAVTTGGGSGLTGFPTTDYTWQNQHNNSATVISIPTAGTYTFDVWMREAGMVVDKLWLSITPDVIANDSTAAGPLESPRSTSP